MIRPVDSCVSHAFGLSAFGSTLQNQTLFAISQIAQMAPVNGLAHWIITQRTIHIVLPNKTEVLRNEKPVPAIIKTVGDFIRARRKEAGLTREILSKTTGISLHWLGRWERDRAMPSPAEWSKLGEVLRLPVWPEIT
jgi:DNA-binding transcriptional regulator YiaG